jgi:hypothetical protein
MRLSKTGSRHLHLLIVLSRRGLDAFKLKTTCIKIRGAYLWPSMSVRCTHEILGEQRVPQISRVGTPFSGRSSRLNPSRPEVILNLALDSGVSI